MAEAQRVLPPGLGWCSWLRAPSQERKDHQNQGVESAWAHFLQRQRWGGTYLGCFGAPSKALMRLYLEGDLCQLSGLSVRTAVSSPGCW